MTLGGHSGRAHPSLAKLRDNILNGTIDFAEVPIVDMNPEDIRVISMSMPYITDRFRQNSNGYILNLGCIS